MSHRGEITLYIETLISGIYLSLREWLRIGDRARTLISAGEYLLDTQEVTGSNPVGSIPDDRCTKGVLRETLLQLTPVMGAKWLRFGRSKIRVDAAV
jgi:hypothetical protein